MNVDEPIWIEQDKRERRREKILRFSVGCDGGGIYSVSIYPKGYRHTKEQSSL